MFTFIIDPPTSTYVVLLAVVVVTGLMLLRYQDRKRLIPFAAALGAFLALLAIDRAFESPREEAARRVQAMAAAATAGDPDRFVEHLSPSFEMVSSADGTRVKREAMKKSVVWALIRTHQARVAVWDFSRDRYAPVSDTEFEIGFNVKAEASGSAGMVLHYARAWFVKDPDGAYRLKTVKFYNPATSGLNAESPLPGFP